MTYFSKIGTTFRPTGIGEIHTELPAANYILKYGERDMTGFYLEYGEGFKLPQKIYGNCAANSERILNTFKERGRNTGVLLVGVKGSGKTLLMRKISVDSNLPVIIINKDFVGDNFNSFLSSITQPAIVIFDEFEKIYQKERQEQILTLLDGTYQSNKLFLITSNDKWGLDANMINRPGRIYYMFEFKGIEESFIRDYCEDNLTDKSKIDRIVALSRFFQEFNFDMLVAVVEETNRYGEDPGSLLTTLNIRPEYSGSIYYDIVHVKVGDIIVPEQSFAPSNVSLAPFDDGAEMVVYIKFCYAKDSGMNASMYSSKISDTKAHQYVEWLEKEQLFFGPKNDNNPNMTEFQRYVHLESSDIVKTDGNTIVYQTEDGFTVTLTRSAQSRRSHYAYSTF